MQGRNVFISLAAAGFGAGCLVPQSTFDQKKLETDSCYEALRLENERKRDLLAAASELERAIGALNQEHQRLSQEKGLLEGSLATLRADVASKMGEINRLARQKRRLEKERAKLTEKTETYDALVASLQQEMKDKLIHVRRKGERITVNVSDRVLFASGSAIIKATGEGSLAKIAGVLAWVKDRRIDVEGHTDNRQISDELAAQFPTNWELSTARATNVVRFLETKGVNPKHMAAVGKSMYRPVASNKSSRGRQTNRRIEIVLTPWDGK